MSQKLTLPSIVALLFIAHTQATANTIVGRILGEEGVSQTGEATYSIPIFVIPGANDLTPELALTYGHRAGEGMSGVGWGVTGLSEIRRCQKTTAQDGNAGAVELATTDRYCLDGNQLKHVGGTYGVAGSTYRTEVDMVARITANGTAGAGPAWFKVESKQGLIYEYGNTTDSRIETLAIGHESTARTWALSKISDRSGNEIHFYYEEDGAPYGNYRIDRIEYQVNPGAGVTTPGYRIRFTYEIQPAGDVDTQYGMGAVIEDVKRLTRIRLERMQSGATTNLRWYDLTYESSLSSTSRSRLQSIQECAGDPVQCYSITTFNYRDGTSGLAAEVSSGSTIPTGVSPFAIDINGDGRTDLVYASSSGSGFWVYRLATASGGYANAVTTSIANTGFDQAITLDYNADGVEDLLVPYSGSNWWAIQGSTSGTALQSPIDTGAPFEIVQGSAIGRDLNGDGRDDLVWANNKIGKPRGLYVRYREASGGFSATATTLIPQSHGTKIRLKRFQNERARHFDVDGDGLEDLAYFVVNARQGVHNLSVKYGNGNGGQVASGFNAGTQGFPIDVNGDGYTDLGHYWINTYGGADELHYRISTGVTFASPVALTVNNLDLDNLIVVDWDSDGYDDILVPSTVTGTWHLYRSTGVGFMAAVNTGIAANSPAEVFATDSNGDGLADVAYEKTSGVYAHRPHAGIEPDLLESITDGNGNTVEYTYAPLTDGSVYAKDSNATFPEQDYQQPIYVVQQIERSTGTGTTYMVDYNYAGAQRNLEGRGLNGFRQRTMVDSRTGNKVIETYHRDFPFRSRLSQRELKLSDGTLVQQVSNTWQTLQAGTWQEIYYFPYLSQSVEKNFEAGGNFNGAQINEITTTNLVDSYGTVYDTTIVTTEHVQANGAQPGASFTQRTLLSQMQNNVATWCIGRAERVQQFGSHQQVHGEQITRTTDFAWDTSASCRIDQMVVEPGDSNYEVTIDIGYDNFGNVNNRTVTGTGMASRTTSVNWGGAGQFPQITTNPLGHVTFNSWNFDTGTPLSVTDPNGLVTSYEFDEFGRLTRETTPDATYRDITLTDCNSANSYCGTGYSLVKTQVRTSSRTTAGVEIRFDDVFLDSMDRTIETAGQVIGGATSRTRTIYDTSGRVEKQSAPSFSTASLHYSEILYDAVSRPTRYSRPIHDGATTQQYQYLYYEGLTTRIVDAEGQETSKILDAVGRVYQSRDNLAHYQQFEYDGFGSIRRVQDCLVSTCAPLTTITYAYGADPYKLTSDDMNLGLWEYQPNALGEVTAYNDANTPGSLPTVSTATFTFDKLGRPLTRNEPEGETTWTWGTSAAAKNIGQLASVSAPGHSQGYTFDNLGRLSQHRRVGDGTYDVDYSYSTTTGLLDSIQYPESTGGYRFKVLREYDHGLLKRVKRSDNGQLVYWEAVAQDAFGNVIDADFGNGTTTLRGFDGVTGRIDYIDTAKGATQLQNLSYTWDRVGNLLQRNDITRALIEDFSYDSLHRLDFSQLNTVTNLDLSYAANGNILTKDDVSATSWTYDSTKKHAVVSDGVYSYGYDDNGNMTSRKGDTITWASYNYPTHIVDGPRDFSYSYDADRLRWKQVATVGGQTETTIFVGDIFEENTHAADTEHRHYIWADGEAVAIFIERTSGTDYTRYLTYDHLGSIEGIIKGDGSGAYVNENFTAFGERRDPNDWSGPPSVADLDKIANTTDVGFTTHLNLEESTLVHMRGRVFDARLGRSLSPDPYIPDPMNTQAYNRYSYVYNNPLKYTDPTGFSNLDIPDFFSWEGAVIVSAINYVLGKIIGANEPPPPDWCGGDGGGPTGCYGVSASRVDAFNGDYFDLPSANSGVDNADNDNADADDAEIFQKGISLEHAAELCLKLKKRDCRKRATDTTKREIAEVVRLYHECIFIKGPAKGKAGLEGVCAQNYLIREWLRRKGSIDEDYEKCDIEAEMNCDPRVTPAKEIFESASSDKLE